MPYKDPIKLIENKARYYQAHREQRAEYKRQYREAHPEKVKELERLSYQRRRNDPAQNAVMVATTRRYEETHREQINARARAAWEVATSDQKMRKLEIGREHYRRNQSARVAGVRMRQRELWELANSYKDRPCMDCGIQYPPCVLDFDHRMGETKDTDISKLVTRGNKARLLREIEKCDVVCVNCHRMRTCRTHHVTHQHATPEKVEQ